MEEEFRVTCKAATSARWSVLTTTRSRAIRCRRACNLVFASSGIPELSSSWLSTRSDIRKRPTGELVRSVGAQSCERFSALFNKQSKTSLSVPWKRNHE